MATAVQVESIWNGLTDNSGQPLAAGKVYTYAAGTTTPISLYTSSDKSTSATNPLILDGNGKAQVWADGRYKFVVKSAADVTLYTLDNLLYGFDDTTVLFGGVSTGSANAQVVSVPATVENYSNGQQITFIAGYTNTGAVTLKFNSLSAVSLVKGPSASSLEAGDLISGQMYTCQYYGGSFRLQDYPTVADVQRSRFQIASSVAGVNTITANLVPALTGYETGLTVLLKAASTTTSAATINLNGLGAKAIQYRGGALTGGEIQQDGFYELVYDGTQFQLRNPYYTNEPLWGGTSTGTATAYAITATPGISAYKTGQSFRFISHVTSGASPTLAVGALGAKTIKQRGSALTGSEIRSGDVVTVVYDGTDMLLLDSVTPPLYLDKANGRVGIGQTTPTGLLHVGDGSAQTYIKLQGNASATAAGQGIEFGTSGNVGNQSAILGGAYNNTLMMWANTNPISLYTSGAHRVYVTSGGSVGVGTTSPTDLFTVGDGTTTMSASINGTTSGTGGGQSLKFGSVGAIGNYSRVVGGAYNAAFTMRAFGSLALAADSGGFSMAGLTGGTGGSAMKWNSGNGVWFYDTSAARYKENIRDSTLGLATVKALRPRQYNYVYEGKPEDVGFVAEEVEPILPYLVSKNGDGQCESITYDRLTSVLVKAVQELSAQVEALEVRIAALEAQ